MTYKEIMKSEDLKTRYENGEDGIIKRKLLQSKIDVNLDGHERIYTGIEGIKEDYGEDIHLSISKNNGIPNFKEKFEERIKLILDRIDEFDYEILGKIDHTEIKNNEDRLFLIGLIKNKIIQLRLQFRFDLFEVEHYFSEDSLKPLKMLRNKIGLQPLKMLSNKIILHPIGNVQYDLFLVISEHWLNVIKRQLTMYADRDSKVDILDKLISLMIVSINGLKDYSQRNEFIKLIDTVSSYQKMIINYDYRFLTDIKPEYIEEATTLIITHSNYIGYLTREILIEKKVINLTEKNNSAKVKTIVRKIYKKINLGSKESTFYQFVISKTVMTDYQLKQNYKKGGSNDKKELEKIISDILKEVKNK